jgi:hypothetical protein
VFSENIIPLFVFLEPALDPPIPSSGASGGTEIAWMAGQQQSPLQERDRRFESGSLQR